jgi:hypothetical protein
VLTVDTVLFLALLVASLRQLRQPVPAGEPLAEPMM